MDKIKKDKRYIESKKNADKVYKKNSAYKSQYLYKLIKNNYPDLYDKIQDIRDNNQSDLRRWIKEKWSYYDSKNDKFIPCGKNENVSISNPKVCNPLIRINKKTPKTWNEILNNSGLNSYSEIDKILRNRKRKVLKQGKNNISKNLINKKA